MSDNQAPLAPFVLAIKDIASGSAGGIAQCFTGHPFDTLKVRLQTQSHTNPKYSGTLDCVKTTIREEGILGLYKGIQSPLVGLTVFNAIQFLSYGQTKSFIQSTNANDEPMSIKQFLLAGAIVGFTVAFVESPMDFLKSQLQIQYGPVKKYDGLLDCAQKIVKEGGIRGIYQGFGATMFRDIPATAIYFGLYEYLKKTMQSSDANLGQLSSWKLLTAGGIAGMGYWVLTFPLDVVKSTMQTDATKISERRYRNWIHAAQSIFHSQGFRGFFRGFTPCVLRAFPANAACFWAYEQTRRILA